VTSAPAAAAEAARTARRLGPTGTWHLLTGIGVSAFHERSAGGVQHAETGQAASRRWLSRLG
jgi:hypothetical protein